MQYSTHLLRHLRFTIGQNIRALRTVRKLPLQKLSLLTGIPEYLLDRFELGKHNIGSEELLRIACAFNVESGNYLMNDMTLIPISSPEYDVDIDIRYATSDNFTSKPVYKAGKCFLHPKAAEAFQRAIALAKALGLRFIVFDAYRPSEAQWKLWEHTPDPDFLADPNKGSPHSRGVAIDLNLTDSQGRELNMGTAFDAFTPLSHHGRTDISVEAQKNRLLLMGIMTTAGWDFYRNEWWHYQLFNSREYPLLSDAESGTGMM